MLNNIQVQMEEDTVDSGAYGLLDTNVYEATVKYVFVTENTDNQGASATVSLDIGGKEITEKMIIQTKEGNNVDKNGKQLKGLSMLNTLCMLASYSKDNSHSLGFPDCWSRKKEKLIEIYDYNAKEKVPTAKNTLPDVVGGKIAVCIVRQKVDKKEPGTWAIVGEKEVNVMAKFLETKTFKPVSILIEEDKPVDQQNQKLLQSTPFIDLWLEKWEGKVEDKTTKDSGSKVKTMQTKPTASTARTSL